MKTRINVQKTAAKTAAIFLIVLLSASSIVSEAKTKKRMDATNTIQAATEKKMVLENWMTDAAKFNSVALPEPATEAPMQIEDWMTKDRLFESASAALVPAVESELEIESWMIDENNFSPKVVTAVKSDNKKKVELWKVQEEKYGNRKFILTQVKDRELKLESWMMDKNYW